MNTKGRMKPACLPAHLLLPGQTGPEQNLDTYGHDYTLRIIANLKNIYR